jgi:hypothetical protein
MKLLIMQFSFRGTYVCSNKRETDRLLFMNVHINLEPESGLLYD